MENINKAMEREMGSIKKPAYVVICGLFTLFQITKPSTVVNLIFSAAPQTAFDYNSQGRNVQTIITEWDLMESRAWIPGLLQSLFFVGFMPGTIVFGQLSDLYGRKSVAWKIYALALITQIFAGFCQSWQQLGVCRVIRGFLWGGLSVVDAILIQELSGSKLWVLNGILGSVMFTMNTFIFIVFAYYFPSWRTLYFISALPGITGFIFFFIAPESPRWLASHGKHGEAEKALLFLVKLNGRDRAYQNLRGETESSEDSDDEQPNDERQREECDRRDSKISLLEGDDLLQAERKAEISLKIELKKSNSVLDVMRHPELRYRTLIMAFQWFSGSLIFFGLTLGSGFFSKNFYLAHIISVLSQLPGLPVTMLALEKPWGGRRRTLAALTFLVSVITFLTYIVRFNEEISDYKLILLLFGKLGASASFTLIYIYTAELYPTVVRNVGLGAMSFCARIGGIIAPFLANSTVFSDQYSPFLWYGFFSGLCCSLALFLPETRGKSICNTLDDLDSKEEE